MSSERDDLAGAVTTVVREIVAVVTSVAVAVPDSSVTDRATTLVTLAKFRDALKRANLPRRAVPSESETNAVLGETPARKPRK